MDLGKGGDDDRRVEHDHQLDGEDESEDDGGVSGAAAKAGHGLAAPLKVGSESGRMETPSGRYGACLHF
jgi:hypothetical protein